MKEDYTPYVDRVREQLVLSPSIRVACLSMNVDGSICFLAKYNGKYYNTKIPCAETHVAAIALATRLTRETKKHFKLE